jgi:hypothetical protein
MQTISYIKQFSGEGMKLLCRTAAQMATPHCGTNGNAAEKIMVNN